ncbi:MAG: hypothetical protein HDT09_02260 [Bacteroidales bacterium]|nr:hypothetical protein [Bacteroidales bacterium]
MSDVNNNAFQGDATVGRHLSVGGDATVNGKARIKRSLRVDGFLDAPNLVGCHKGYFISAEALKDAYPRPEEGWWAVVGESEDVNTTIYAVRNEGWYNTGKRPILQVPGQVYEEALDNVTEHIIRMSEADRANEDNILRVEYQMGERIDALEAGQAENKSGINRVEWDLNILKAETIQSLEGDLHLLEKDFKTAKATLTNVEGTLSKTSETAENAYNDIFNHIEDTHRELDDTVSRIGDSIKKLNSSMTTVQEQVKQAMSIADDAVGEIDLEELESRIDESLDKIRKELTTVRSDLDNAGSLALEAYRATQDLPDRNDYKRIREMAEDCIADLNNLRTTVNDTKGEIEQLRNDLPVLDLGDLPSRVAAVECECKSHGTAINSALRNSTDALSIAHTASNNADEVRTNIDRLATTLSGNLKQLEGIAEQARLTSEKATDAVECFKNGKGAPGGFAILDKDGHVPVEQIPPCVMDEVHNAMAVASEAKSTAKAANETALLAERSASLAESCAKSAEKVSSEALEHVHQFGKDLKDVEAEVENISGQVELLQPTVEQMDKRMEALPTFLPIDGRLRTGDPEPTQGVWLIDNDEGGVMFECYGDDEYYGYGEEAYNCDYQAITTGYYTLLGEIFIIQDNELVSLTDILKDAFFIETTYSDLKWWRDTNRLIPGARYRITDFVTTVANDPEARSAGHQFDLIVLATDKGELSEEAMALAHKDDAYFRNANLSAWKVWYCLDNNTTRFGWADTENGKGVIYRLIDEFSNDCPYDFKNVQFKRYGIQDTDFGLNIMNGYLFGFNTEFNTYNEVDINESRCVWAYTFSIYNYDEKHPEQLPEVLDGSMDYAKLSYNESNHCAENKIDAYRTRTFNNLDAVIRSETLTQWLNNIVCVNSINLGVDGNIPPNKYLCNNSIGAQCYNMTIAGSDNTISSNCRDIIIGIHADSNKISTGCDGIVIEDFCSDNVIGHECFGIQISPTAYRESQVPGKGNTIKAYCAGFHICGPDNVFGDNCRLCYINGPGNQIGSNCEYINFGYYYSKTNYVKIGANCRDIIIQTGYSTVIGSDCKEINLFEAVRCTIGDSCSHIKSGKNSYCHSLEIGDCSECILLQTDAQNAKIMPYFIGGGEKYPTPISFECSDFELQIALLKNDGNIVVAPVSKLLGL